MKHKSFSTLNFYLNILSYPIVLLETCAQPTEVLAMQKVYKYITKSQEYA